MCRAGLWERTAGVVTATQAGPGDNGSGAGLRPASPPTDPQPGGRLPQGGATRWQAGSRPYCASWPGGTFQLARDRAGGQGFRFTGVPSGHDCPGLKENMCGSLSGAHLFFQPLSGPDVGHPPQPRSPSSPSQETFQKEAGPKPGAGKAAVKTAPLSEGGRSGVSLPPLKPLSDSDPLPSGNAGDLGAPAAGAQASPRTENSRHRAPQRRRLCWLRLLPERPRLQPRKDRPLSFAGKVRKQAPRHLVFAQTRDPGAFLRSGRGHPP